MQAGETVQLQCLAHGTPPLTFQWSRVGGSLPGRATTRNEMLLLEPAAPADSGRYRCQVTNKVGSAEAFAQVLVRGEQPQLRLGRMESAFLQALVRAFHLPLSWCRGTPTWGMKTAPPTPLAGTPSFPPGRPRSLFSATLALTAASLPWH